MIQTDRTRILTGLRCRRERFLAFHFLGRGLQRKTTKLPLAFGSAYHEGEEDLFNGKDVEAAVERAVGYLDGKFTGAAVDLDDPQADYAMAEQKAIAEALVRGWASYVGPRFFRDFEILAVEREGRALLDEDVELLFRPDAEVKERTTGDLYVVSHKTASRFWGGRGGTIDKANVDMQSMSEVYGVAYQTDERPEGVLYSFSIKGQRKMDDYLGQKRQDTPLVYGWMRRGPTAEDTEWAWKYQWPGDDGKLQRLGKGFRKVAIWSEYPGGVKAWIDDLNGMKIAPRHLSALEEAFPQSLPVSRRPDEIESWRRQTVAEERRVASSLVQIGTAPTVEDLDEHFPQNMESCYKFNSTCEMFEICHNAANIGDPLASGLFKLREPNHPLEKVSDGD